MTTSVTFECEESPLKNKVNTGETVRRCRYRYKSKYNIYFYVYSYICVCIYIYMNIETDGWIDRIKYPGLSILIKNT